MSFRQVAERVARDGRLAACEAPLAGERVVLDQSGVLYWPSERMLIVADLHFEKSSSFARRGMLLPPYDTAETLAVLAHRIAHFRPATVVALGDSFHDGDGPARLTAEARDALAAMMAGRDWLWVAGNHDPDPPEGLGGRAAGVVAVGPIALRHEPGAPLGAGGGEVSGHLHPVGRIVRAGRAVQRRCFALDGRRLVLPSFGALTGGLNVRHPAFSGLFEEPRFHAHLIGRDAIYTIAGRDLV